MLRCVFANMRVCLEFVLRCVCLGACFLKFCVITSLFLVVFVCFSVSVLKCLCYDVCMLRFVCA